MFSITPESRANGIIFVHVPKTGGTSVDELFNRFEPGSSERRNRIARAPIDRSLVAAYETAVQAAAHAAGVTLTNNQSQSAIASAALAVSSGIDPATKKPNLARLALVRARDRFRIVDGKPWLRMAYDPAYQHPAGVPQLSYIQREGVISPFELAGRGQSCFEQLAAIGPGAHWTAEEIRLRMGVDSWRRHEIVAMVRNPFDRLVSEYAWRQKLIEITKGGELFFPLPHDASFEDFVYLIDSTNNRYIQGASPMQSPSSSPPSGGDSGSSSDNDYGFVISGSPDDKHQEAMAQCKRNADAMAGSSSIAPVLASDHLWPQVDFMRTGDGQFLVHHILRFEDMATTVPDFFEHRGYRRPTLLHMNESKHARDYRSYYSSETRAIVERIYAEDLKMFGYSF